MLRTLVICAASVLIGGALFLQSGCSGPSRIDDPLAAILDPSLSPTIHHDALSMSVVSPTDPPLLDALQRVMWRPGYTVAFRQEAFDHLEQHDGERLQRTIRQQLPRMTAWKWRERLCSIIGERGWEHQTPALVSGWAVPVVFERDDMKRPEYLALASLHGDDRVVEVVFDVLLNSTRASDQGLRTRCWELLHRLGYRERLIELVASASVPPDDLMMSDLRDAARDFQMVPHNREEILWLRQLRQPEHASFWEAAKRAVAKVPAARRSSLEIRDLPILVSSDAHNPSLMAADRAALLSSVGNRLRGVKMYVREDAVDGRAHRRPTVNEFRDSLTWSDLAAISVALDALEVPQLVSHLFDYADRDQADRSTEYGGVIRLDDQNRFELLEFVPRVRMHDERFNASQAMFDAGYTAQFHFHYHVQRNRNRAAAGPGLGDDQYADSTRANCLVLTLVDEDRMNVDYYRHGKVVIDLGTIQRR